MRKLFITLLITLIGATHTFAQHEIGPSLSSQLFSRINFNPAGIGNSEKVNIFNMNRLQWLGFDGGPKTFVLNGHYFNESLKSGFGATFSYDAIGNSNQAITAKAVYAYNLDISDKGLLSFGLSAGINQFSKDYSDDRWNPDEITLENESKLNPDIDFGIEYSMPYLLVGASINHLGMFDESNTLSPTQTYYGYARGAVPLTKEITLAPALLYMNSGKTNVFDINAVVFYQDLYWGGLSWRINAAVSIMAGFEWNFLRVGYAYEISTGIANYNTHELMLSFIIPTKFEKQKKGRR